MFLWARHVPARSFFEGNGEVPFCSFGALSAEGGGAGDVRLRPPPVCVAAIALFSCGDNIAPECGESSPVGEKRKKLRDCVTMFVLVQKKKKKTAVSCRIEWNELTWLMRSSNAALPMWTPLNKNLRAFLTIFFFS